MSGGRFWVGCGPDYNGWWGGDWQACDPPGGECGLERVRFEEDRCKGCSLCISVCPVDIIHFAERINRLGYHPAAVVEQEKCISCTLCAIVCPDLVIEVFRPLKKASSEAGVAVG